MYNFNVQSAVGLSLPPIFLYSFHSYLSSLAASHVAAHFLKENSLLVLIGAHAAFEGTAGLDPSSILFLA